MDRISDSDSEDAGSIPAGATDKLHKPEDAGSTLPDVLQACDVIAIK
jgi:hypothetical protein